MNWERLRRWRWALLIGGALLIGLAYAFWPAASAVDAGRVTRGPMAVGVTDDGITRAREYYVVAAPVTGYLSRIDLDPGDRVTRGAVIAHMAAPPSAPLDRRTREELRAQLAATQATVRDAAARLAQARSELRRTEQLAPEGIASQADLDAARTAVRTGQAALAQSRAEARRIEARLATPPGAVTGPPVAVRAPVTGSILSVVNENEGVVTEGTTLVTMGDPDAVEVVVDLLSREAVRVRPGDRVEITQWGGSQALPGRVERIEPFGSLKVSALGIEEQRVNVIIGFDDPKRASRLGHGYQVDATILLWSRKDALRVPIGALFRGKEGAWNVFVIDRGRARPRAVKIGHVDDRHGEVLAGLREDELVVLNPGNSLDDGTRVRAR